MVKEETCSEELDNRKITLPFHKKYSVTDLATVPTFDPKYAITPYDKDNKVANLRQGTAAFCLDKNIQQSNLIAARERIKSTHQEVLMYKEWLQ